MALVQELHAHHQVVVEEPSRMRAIGANAADDGRQMDEQIRAGVGIETTDGIAVDQVVLAAAGHEHGLAAAATEPLDHVGAQKPGAARD